MEKIKILNKFYGLIFKGNYKATKLKTKVETLV